MIAEIPKFHETFNPIIDILKNGETFKARELIKLVVENYFSHLTEEQLSEKVKTGENLLNNRISWGKSFLKKGGFVYFPERGSIKITEKGLKENPELLQKSGTWKNGTEEVSLTKSIKSKTETTEIKESINETPQDLIDIGFTQIENEIKNNLLEKLKNIDPYYFEKVILILLKKMGYGDFIETAKSGDGGIDGIINEDKLGLDKIYIQAKRFNENKVREKDIRNFIGAMSGDTNKGVFVTTSLFDIGAVEKAKNAHHKIILIDGKKLVELMHEFNVGVQIKATYEIKQLDEDFFEDE